MAKINKFMMQHDKNNTTNATEEIASALYADNDSIETKNEEVNETLKEISAKENKKETKKTKTTSNDSSTASPKKRPTRGAKGYKVGNEYKRIGCEIEKEVYDAMTDILPVYGNNMTTYLKKLIIDDLNKNYDSYIKEIKDENKNILFINRSTR